MFTKISILFLAWIVGLFAVSFLAIYFLPEFGNRFPYADQVLRVTGLPSFVWGFGNFDGVHYLRIAQNGYNAQYSQAFFPLYPLLVRFLTEVNLLIPKNPTIDSRIFVDPSYFYNGLILSNIFLFLALIVFYKLLKLDFSPKVAYGSLVLLLSFPTPYYFNSIYTESLFLFLVLGSLYCARKDNFLLAELFGGLASATRIFSLLLIPVLLIELWLKFKNKSLEMEEISKTVIGLLLVPFGTLLYMLFLRLNFENPLYFLTSQPLFGAEITSGSLVFFPQVIYRYLKIFMTVPPTTQLFFNALLEFSFTVLVFACLLLFIKKIRPSYLVFALGCLIIPTLTGTFSSMPRYSLMGFLLLPLIVQALGNYYKVLVVFFVAIGIILVSLFTRGYWVA